MKTYKELRAIYIAMMPDGIKLRKKLDILDYIATFGHTMEDIIPTKDYVEICYQAYSPFGDEPVGVDIWAAAIEGGSRSRHEVQNRIWEHYCGVVK